MYTNCSIPVDLYSIPLKQVARTRHTATACIALVHERLGRSENLMLDAY